MANLAGRGEAGRGVIGVRGRLVIRLVAAETFARSSFIYVIFMTDGAGLSNVGTDALEELVVVEYSLVKRRIGRFVASLAGRGKSGRGMVRVGGRLVIRLVAAVTDARRSFVHIVLMAGGARLGGMDPDALEELVVVERALVE